MMFYEFSLKCHVLSVGVMGQHVIHPVGIWVRILNDVQLGPDMG